MEEEKREGEQVEYEDQLPEVEDTDDGGAVIGSVRCV